MDSREERDWSESWEVVRVVEGVAVEGVRTSERMGGRSRIDIGGDGGRTEVEDELIITGSGALRDVGYQEA